jgi:hypothetical protein
VHDGTGGRSDDNVMVASSLRVSVSRCHVRRPVTQPFSHPAMAPLRERNARLRLHGRFVFLKGSYVNSGCELSAPNHFRKLLIRSWYT